MAIRVNSDPADETWAVFVRRFGDEGFYSDQQHYLDDLLNDTFTFGCRGDRERRTWESDPATCLSIAARPGDGKSRGGTEPGSPPVLHDGGPAGPAAPGGDGQRRAAPEVDRSAGRASSPPLDGTLATFSDGRTRPPVAEQREDEPEDRVARLMAGMAPPQRQQFEAKFPARSRLLPHGSRALPGHGDAARDAADPSGSFARSGAPGPSSILRRTRRTGRTSKRSRPRSETGGWSERRGANQTIESESRKEDQPCRRDPNEERKRK